MPATLWPPQLHPLQPALPAHGQQAQRATALQQQMPPPGAMASGAGLNANSAAHSAVNAASAGASAANAANAATPAAASSCRVRCPPSPSRSPPLHVDELYISAGWVSADAGQLAAAMLPGGGGSRSAMLAGGAAGSGSG
eukprot:4868691-Pleurochrysis_carterae.AAC.1